MGDLRTKKTDEPKGFGGKWDDDAAPGGGRGDYKPGNYLVLMVENEWIPAPDEYPRLKVAGLVLLVLEDMGDSNDIGDEVEECLFKKNSVKKGSFFEIGCKAWCKAGFNMSKADAKDLTEGQIFEIMVVEQKLQGRVIEIKVRSEPARARKDGTNPHEGKSFLRYTPQRAFSEAELKALIKRQDAKTKERVMAVINDESGPALVYPDNALAEGEEAE